MALIVQKYGGTSVANLERIKEVARRAAKTFDRGNDIVVVLSAMAGETDRFIELANRISHSVNKRELDVLLATGEQSTVALLAMTLESIGYPSASLLGHQVKIHTDSFFGSARIADIDSDNIKKLLGQKKIVIIAGFQGCDQHQNITTLGRGGSDTSAVAVAAAIKADKCEIYTDVEGVFTADPNICSKARKLKEISYEEMLEMASIGAKVLQTRSVEFAKKYNVALHVRSSFNDKEGTVVLEENLITEKMVVAGITSSKNEALITFKKVPDTPGIAAKIFKPIAEANIIVDMIVQNSLKDQQTDISFTVPISDFKKAFELSEKVVKKIASQEVVGDKNIARVSVTGVGMKSHSGIASTMFSALAQENINIIIVSTSEIRISCLIEAKYAELAVRTLHTAFNLDNDKSNVSLYYGGKKTAPKITAKS
ncbi:MAG: aspartate kinase [Deltaproteobacteria bacterium]|nr:aspartate kinase [Deltaproteobacteria bacterium]